jgi:hypothetical protein
MCKNKKKRYNNNAKRKNLGTVNFNDLPNSTRFWLCDQILMLEANNGSSVVLLVTSPSMSSATASQGCGRKSGNIVILMINVPCLAAGSPLKQMMLITTQSSLLNIVLQSGPELDAPTCPSIRCAVDMCATLLMGNFHFFTAVAKQYPHCLAKMIAPTDYMLLSGIVQTNNKAVTTELHFGFQFHLPYCTLGSAHSSLLMATGLNVLVNTIVCLLFTRLLG